MLKATALIAGSVLLGTASFAVAGQPQQHAQAQTQTQSQIEQDYQNRLRAAKTPEERARIQAEHDRLIQQGAVPGNVQTAPGTAGSGVMPTPPGTDRSAPRPGESPGGSGGVPPGQGGD
jgi:hypothetical protein